MYKHAIAVSRNGHNVYVNLIDSSAGQYLSRQPYVINLLREAVEDLEIKGNVYEVEHDMGRVIGQSYIVKTTDTDSIYYAQPYKNPTFSRYVKNRSPDPSTKLTILLAKDSDGEYEIQDTWIGPYSPPFPGDENTTARSRSYWQTHALVVDLQTVQAKTITKVCPY